MSTQVKNAPKIKKNNQLLDVMDLPATKEELKTYIKDHLVFLPVEQGTVPDSNPPIKFSRINFYIVNPDGTKGDLIVDFDRSYTFGVQQNLTQTEPKVLTGYTTAIAMYDMEGATPRQARTVMFLEVLGEHCKDHALQDSVKEAMNLYNLERSHLEKFNPLFYKTEKGKIIETASPTFYAKLAWLKPGKDKKGNDCPAKMITTYYSEDEVDDNGNPKEVNPLDFEGVPYYIRPAVKISGLFIGKTAKTMQAKIYEADVKPKENVSRRLLKPRFAPATSLLTTPPVVETTTSNNPPVSPTTLKEEKPLVASDEEEEEEKPKNKIVKKKSKKVEKS